MAPTPPHRTTPAATAPTRWLTADEQRTWRSFLMATRLLDGQFERDLQQASGLGMTYYEILVQLSEAPGRTLRMSELAQFAQVSRSALSHAVARLERDGYIERSSCPTDRRGALAHLTDAGFARLEAAAPNHVESVRTHLFDQLSARQVQQLRAISDTLLAHFADTGEDTGTGGGPYDGA